MNSPMVYWQTVLVQLCNWQNETRHTATCILAGSTHTESYGEWTETSTFENHANFHTRLHDKLTAVHPGEPGFPGVIKCQGGPFLGFEQAFTAFIVRKKPARMGSYWNTDSALSSQTHTTMCVGMSTVRLHLIKSSLPSLYPLRHSCNELFQALYRFSVQQATQSWAGPGNVARPFPPISKHVQNRWCHAGVLRRLAGANFSLNTGM